MGTLQLGSPLASTSRRQSAARGSARRPRLFIFGAGALTATLSLTALVGQATASPRPSVSASAMVAVKVATVAKYGKILENQKGLPLYYDTADKAPKHLDCTGGCLSAWPALVLPKGQKKVVIGKGVTGLGTIKDANGVQVTWRSRPLYTFASDSKGHVTGDGVGNFKVVRLPK